MHCPLPVLCLCHDQPVLLLLSFFHLSGRTISKYISLLYLATRLDMPICASSGSQVKCCLAINNCDTDNLVPPDTGISICSCLPHRTSTFLLVIYMIVIVSTFHNKFGLSAVSAASSTASMHQHHTQHQRISSISTSALCI